MMTVQKLKIFMYGVFCMAMCVSVHAISFSQMTVFGDSLSDTGNIDNATFGLVPGGGYFDGRFSNGSLYIEYLAEGLGLAAPIPSSEGGRNYAYGGAWAADQSDFFNDLVVEDLDEQIPNYLAERSPIDGELFVVYAGSNDLVDNPGNVSSAIASLRTEINRLAVAGARQFFVPNLPRLDLVPRHRGTSGEAPLLAAVTAFNLQLDSVLDDLEAQYSDSIIYRLDVATIFADVFAEPETFGFTNVVNEAKDLAGIDPDTYLFWDDLHPTTAGHTLLADFALAAILDPINLLGDYNGNGEVDAADYTLWADSFNTTVTPFTGADGNGDGVIDAADYTVWADNFGNSADLGLVGHSIPEPSSLVLITLVGLYVTHRPSVSRKRRRL